MLLKIVPFYGWFEFCYLYGEAFIIILLLSLIRKKNGMPLYKYQSIPGPLQKHNREQKQF